MTNGDRKMRDFLNGRLFSALLITFGLPIMLYVALVVGSESIAKSITVGVGDAMAEVAIGEDKKTIQQIVSGFTGQLISGVVKAFSDVQKKQDYEKIEEIERIDNLSVDGIKMASSKWGGSRVIGTITNNSDEHIHQITLSISSYDEKGNLQNVDSERMSDLKVIKPKESVNFGVDPGGLQSINGKPNIVPARVEVTVSSAAVLKPKEKSDGAP